MLKGDYGLLSSHPMLSAPAPAHSTFLVPGSDFESCSCSICGLNSVLPKDICDSHLSGKDIRISDKVPPGFGALNAIMCP